MTNVVPADWIEDIVGASRREFAHLGRAVSNKQTLYILHSNKCIRENPDLRDCEFSMALDNGLEEIKWRGSMDKPVSLVIHRGKLLPYRLDRGF